VKDYARQMRAYEERAREQVAPPGSAYAKRLAALADRFRKYDGLVPNFKVYLSKQVNANASADGSIHVYTGLMDLMSDQELLFVIGYVKGGHSAKAMRTALTTSGLRKAATAVSGSSLRIADAQLGGLIAGVVNAQHSQSQEIQSDDYGLAFMKKNNIPPAAAESALRKLAGLSKGSATILSSHPDPGKRADRMAKAR